MLRIAPFNNQPFGALAEDFDCTEIEIESASRIRKALYRYQLLIFPNQQHLSPADEVRFYRHVDDQAQAVWRDQVNNPWEVFKVEQGNAAGTYQIPDVPGVLVLGKGEIDHHGLRVTLGGDRNAYGDDEGSQVLGGGALQWHIDGTFYRYEPCQFTQMTCIEAPKGGGHWLQYEDGTDARLWCEAGATAFASGRIAFELLSHENRAKANDLLVHYLSNPFQSTYHLGNNGNGLRVSDPESEAVYYDGKELPGEPVNDPDAKVHPLVWTCPGTGEKALMLHPRCMDHLEERSGGRHLGRAESSLMVEQLMRPAIQPETVYIHPWREGDLAIWHNRSLWHSATGKLSRNDRRIQHLTAFNGTVPPV
jgi:alpha-ketoglutarate-dependent taurine dioxygenase